MKNLFIPLVFIANIVFAQVGINTPDPKATLDIMAKNPTGSTQTPEGILIPRVDRERAQSMSNIVTSTLIYVDNITTGTPTDKAIYIDEIGYYLFNGQNWVKLNANIYNSDGALSGNRIVNQGDKTLAFTSNNVINAFSVAGKTFSVDAKNKWIGFGTAAPSSKFEIISDNEGPNSGNNFYFKGFGTSKEPSLILSSANGTVASPKNLTAGDYVGSLYFAPRANNVFNTATGSSISSYYRGDGTSILTDLVLRTSNKSRIYINENGNVGIGTDTPANKLDINSSTAGAVKIVDGTQGADKVLTSDADGVATWKQTSVAFGTVNVTSADYTLPANTNTCKYVGVPITLPAGKWLLSLNVGIEHPTKDATSTDTNFIRFRLGDSTADFNDFISDSMTPKLASQGFSRATKKGMVIGSLAVNNTSSAPKTYYLFVDNINSDGEKNETIIRLQWNETSINYQKIQ
ncbi:hypothetical protein [Chryseobacterium sp. ERMR1:04]|uniref:hypothetical protein n=1 Tax=Chryseobacterium sp. ERMR1:04 TaxID=1705393 RepID=UPI0006C83CBF|nr:hypothetical protein [Chryseobacterium sp. ERMR1:04]